MDKRGKKLLKATLQWLHIILNFFLKEILKPTLILILSFLFIAFIYKTWTGITRETISAQQLEGVIQKSLPHENADYTLLDVDFHGFGLNSLFVATFTEESPESIGTFNIHSIEDEPNKYPEMIIFDEVQLSPIENLLFTGIFYKETFKFQPYFSDNESYISPLEPPTILTYKNKKQRITFCYSYGLFSYCGILQYNNKFEILPLLGNDILDITERGMINEKINSNLGVVELTKIPYTYVIDFRRNGEELYIGSPVLKEQEEYWIHGAYSYQICKYLFFNAESYYLLMSRAAEYCYTTDYKLSFSNIYDSYIRNEDLYTKEIDKNIDRVWPW